MPVLFSNECFECFCEVWYHIFLLYHEYRMRQLSSVTVNRSFNIARNLLHCLSLYTRIFLIPYHSSLSIPFHFLLTTFKQWHTEKQSAKTSKEKSVKSSGQTEFKVQLLKHIIQPPLPVAVWAPATCYNICGQRTSFSIKTVMCSIILTQNKCTGLLVVHTENPQNQKENW